MDAIPTLCPIFFVLITFSVEKCEALYCYYSGIYYTLYSGYYCPSYSFSYNYNYYYSYELSVGAIVGIVIGGLVALGFVICCIIACCVALGSACSKRPTRVSTIPTVQSTNVFTTQHYNQMPSYGYGQHPAPSAPSPYSYSGVPSFGLQQQHPPPYQPQNSTIPPPYQPQNSTIPPPNQPQISTLSSQTPPRSHVTNPFAINN